MPAGGIWRLRSLSNIFSITAPLPLKSARSRPWSVRPAVSSASLWQATQYWSMKALSGAWREVHWLVYLVAALFVWRYLALPLSG